jgi:hypothetical protein
MIPERGTYRRPVRKKKPEAKEERAAIVAMLRHRVGALSAEANKLHEEHHYEPEQLIRSDVSMLREVIRWIEAMP